jgi:uncharacterized membrane protein
MAIRQGSDGTRKLFCFTGNVEMLATLWTHIHYGYISIHTTAVILVIIHIHYTSSNV